MTVEQSVDQVQVARPAASCADREGAGDGSIRAGSEGGGFLVTDTDPLDFA